MMMTLFEQSLKFKLPLEPYELLTLSYCSQESKVLSLLPAIMVCFFSIWLQLVKLIGKVWRDRPEHGLVVGLSSRVLLHLSQDPNVSKTDSKIGVFDGHHRMSNMVYMVLCPVKDQEKRNRFNWVIDCLCCNSLCKGKHRLQFENNCGNAYNHKLARITIKHRSQLQLRWSQMTSSHSSSSAWSLRASLRCSQKQPC